MAGYVENDLLLDGIEILTAVTMNVECGGV
jgi:hypothetical protein